MTKTRDEFRSRIRARLIDKAVKEIYRDFPHSARALAEGRLTQAHIVTDAVRAAYRRHLLFANGFVK